MSALRPPTMAGPMLRIFRALAALEMVSWSAAIADWNASAYSTVIRRNPGKAHAKLTFNSPGNNGVTDNYDKILIISMTISMVTAVPGSAAYNLPNETYNISAATTAGGTLVANAPGTLITFDAISFSPAVTGGQAFFSQSNQPKIDFGSSQNRNVKYAKISATKLTDDFYGEGMSTWNVQTFF